MREPPDPVGDRLGVLRGRLRDPGGGAGLPVGNDPGSWTHRVGEATRRGAVDAITLEPLTPVRPVDAADMTA